MSLLLMNSGLQLLGVYSIASITAGTPTQLTNLRCKKVVIQTDAANASVGADGTIVAVGNSAVDADSVPPKVIAMLYPTQREEFFVDNANALYVDATVTGAAISYAVFG